MAVSEAMKQYVTVVSNLSPQWKGNPPCDGAGEEGVADRGGRGSGGTGGPVVSTLMNNMEVIPDEKKTVFDWCKEGDVTRLSGMLTESNINSLDEQVGIA